MNPSITNPAAIDPKLKLTGVLLGIAVAAAALLGGYATVNAISARLAIQGAPPLIGLMSLIDGIDGDEASLQGDYQTASGDDDGAFGVDDAGRSEIADSLTMPVPAGQNPFLFWPDREGQLSAKDWVRTQLARLPDGASAYLNSSSRRTWVIQMVRTFETADGRTCREFSVAAKAPRRSDKLFDAACHRAFGPWKSNVLGEL